MLRKLLGGSFRLLAYFVSSYSLSATDSHLSDLKLKYPHGLLGNDFGILSVSDLSINVCGVRPMPFNPNSQYYPFEYWQCFESKVISFRCKSNRVPDLHEGLMALIVVNVSIKDHNNDFIAPRFWPIEDCKKFIRHAANLIKNTKHSCISGSFIENEVNRSGNHTRSWLFGRIKSKKGCIGRDCDFTKKFKQENCPTLK